MIAAGGLPPSHRLELGRRAMEAHDYTRAAALAEPVVQALDGATDVDQLRLLVRALAILACSRHEVAADESWSALLDRAQGLVESSGLDDLRVPVVGATAYCHLRAGDVHAALALFDSADTWLEDATVEDRVRFLLNRGFARLELGNLRAAGRDLDRVEEEGTRAGLHELAQKARHNLGYLAFLEGDLPGLRADRQGHGSGTPVRR